jgi:hypothetical protein
MRADVTAVRGEDCLEGFLTEYGIEHPLQLGVKVRLGLFHEQ